MSTTLRHMREVSPIIEINLQGRATYNLLKIGEEGYKTFTYACITLLQQVKRKNSHIYRKVKKDIFERF